ncbi:molybdopterin synthase small subunit CnxG [Paracoccidioides lutzii Pb01]|uniref:Molybdopterin synthase sulfur carrier subunit n=1 Tax=Paracoccidioides lutzii (strain ATCC MYA-826 / Pb01) TaxID=502779 RepID=C1H7U6_PARBA|nr:molybdopterin synthase small subunit CnxG [Paracoccidioides lutzii Pb01]EEH36419.1 molybdopterin synthase small subunit CnxG [Paracoccidioides lutzii Pb01]
MTPPTFQIHYFATASSYTKKQTETLPAPLPLSKLFDLLESRYPGIKEKVLVSCAVSVGLEYVDVDADVVNVDGKERKDARDVRIIGPGEEVAIIPPVSSG